MFVRHTICVTVCVCAFRFKWIYLICHRLDTLTLRIKLASLLKNSNSEIECKNSKNTHRTNIGNNIHSSSSKGSNGSRSTYSLILCNSYPLKSIYQCFQVYAYALAFIYCAFATLNLRIFRRWKFTIVLSLDNCFCISSLLFCLFRHPPAPCVTALRRQPLSIVSITSIRFVSCWLFSLLHSRSSIFVHRFVHHLPEILFSSIEKSTLKTRKQLPKNMHNLHWH